MPFGFHEDLPGLSKYITMLRNPTDKVLSTYYSILSDVTSPHHQELAEIDLLTFANGLVEHRIDNLQVRLISGSWDFQGPSSPDLLEKAINNLKQCFIAVGFTERFDESLLLIRKTLSWQHQLFYTRKNVTSGRPKYNDIPRDVLDVIEQNNQLDMKLYEYVQASKDTRNLIYKYNELDWELYETIASSFDKRLSLAGIDQLQLKRFQVLNSQINRLPFFLRRGDYKIWGWVERY